MAAGPEEAAKLLKRVKAAGAQPCLTFHVGSQCLSPFSYAQAIEIAQRTINLSGVEIAALDVGGGFPAAYAGQEPPPYHWYFDMIQEALQFAGPARSQRDVRAGPRLGGARHLAGDAGGDAARRPALSQ